MTSSGCIPWARAQQPRSPRQCREHDTGAAVSCLEEQKGPTFKSEWTVRAGGSTPVGETVFSKENRLFYHIFVATFCGTLGLENGPKTHSTTLEKLLGSCVACKLFRYLATSVMLAWIVRRVPSWLMCKGLRCRACLIRCCCLQLCFQASVAIA